ncbi:energy transducer TonB [uncultured Sphingomonas sp.]|uniref:energy transducer TonB n=1 Tax=uncultured Sphingomonas sp. TaxID=158754 RepID=UPI002587F30B|nr:energy transducer TonB [uncultured Sphingomonas sp.]
MRRFLRMGAAVATLCCGGGAWGQTDPTPIDPASWVTNDDFPAEALRKDEKGIVKFALSVNPAGRPTGCRIVETSGSALLDQTTCRVMVLRGVFKPATDKHGRPVTGEWEQRVNWQPPSDYLQPLLPFQSISRIVIGPNGNVTDCTSRLAGDPSVQFDVCTRYGDSYPARDVAKGYGPGVLTFTLSQTVDGVSASPTSPTSEIPPNWTVEEQLTIDPSGVVQTCRKISSNDGTTDCPVGNRYMAPESGKPVRIVKTTSTAFQPAK